MPRYKGSGKLQPWKRQVRRWRRAGLSWPSIGRLLYALGIWTVARYDRDRPRGEYALAMLAYHEFGRL